MKKGGLFFLLGGLVGVIVGLLVAPRSGKETIRRLNSNFYDVKDNNFNFVKGNYDCNMKNFFKKLKRDKSIIEPEKEIIISKEFE
ncbi:YtxH domain-containing protein [Peptostreptococcaceae bacterium AGR-M142]